MLLPAARPRVGAGRKCVSTAMWEASRFCEGVAVRRLWTDLLRAYPVPSTSLIADAPRAALAMAPPAPRAALAMVPRRMPLLLPIAIMSLEVGRSGFLPIAVVTPAPIGGRAAVAVAAAALPASISTTFSPPTGCPICKANSISIITGRGSVGGIGQLVCIVG